MTEPTPPPYPAMLVYCRNCGHRTFAPVDFNGTTEPTTCHGEQMIRIAYSSGLELDDEVLLRNPITTRKDTT